ncbi:hypothetical protein [Enterovibrio norvegicus]|uniref:hypothetical protein n=1 Tax=Enterovibrio norvegicus TaxID=188144 RepID=UPI00352E11CC
MKIELAPQKTGEINVLINNVHFGVFDNLVSEAYTFYPKYTDRMNGDHYILIGHALNELNKTAQTTSSTK